MRRYLVVIVFFCFAASTAMAQSALDQPASVTSAQANQPQIDWNQVDAEAIQRLIEYVRVDTTNPPGNEIRGVEWLKKIFQAEEIPFETGESAPGRGNIAARLKGTGQEPAVILLSHIDVVPVNREFWTVDPRSPCASRSRRPQHRQIVQSSSTDNRLVLR